MQLNMLLCSFNESSQQSSSGILEWCFPGQQNLLMTPNQVWGRGSRTHAHRIMLSMHCGFQNFWRFSRDTILFLEMLLFSWQFKELLHLAPSLSCSPFWCCHSLILSCTGLICNIHHSIAQLGRTFNFDDSRTSKVDYDYELDDW